MKYIFKLFVLSSILTGCLLFSNSVQGQNDWLNKMTVSYDDCDGCVTVKFLIGNRETCGFQDRIGYLELEYQGPTTGLGSWLFGGGTFFFMDNVGSTIRSPMTTTVLLNENGTCDASKAYWLRTGATYEQTYTENEIYGTVKFCDMDNDMFGGQTKILVTGWYDHVPGGGINWDENTSVFASGTQQSIGTPTLQSVSTDECAFRKVQWTNQNGTVSSCPDSKKYTIVQRSPKGANSWSTEATIRFDANPSNSYSDPDGLPGVEYDYRVFHRFQPNSSRQNDSSPSSSRTGKKKEYPIAPTSPTASTDRCDGGILVSWNNPGNTGVIEYQISSNYPGPGFAPVDTITDPNTSSWLDSGVPPNIPVLYRLQSFNIDCNTSSETYTETPAPGISPNDPTAPTTVTANVNSTGGIDVSWDDNSSDETGYIIERTFPGGGGAFIEERPANATSWTDTNVNSCVTYTYKLKVQTDCFPDGSGEITDTAKISPDLSSTFDPQSGFRGSKGYFTDKVELTWNNLNTGNTNTTEIWRRVLGSGQDSSLLVTLNGGSGIYNDNSASAGILYEYFIIAKGQCEGTQISSNVESTIGFRQKSGRVSGKITYDGGTAVENVKVVAESGNALIGSSIKVAGGKLTIENASNQDVSDKLIIESWINPSSLSSSYDIVNRPNSYRLHYDNGDGFYKFEIFSGLNMEIVSMHKDSIHNDSIPTGQWKHIAAQLRNDSLVLYANGKKISESLAQPATSINNPIVDIDVLQGFQGNAKELRIWNINKDDDLLFRDYSRFTNPSALGLNVYFPFSEAIGNYAYDRSKSGIAIFNRNHGLFAGNVMWSTDVPTLSQLSYAAYTNDKGNYTLILPYYNAGEDYTLTPIFPDHEFELSERLLFVGDGSSVQNGIDFTDVSSFPVTGTLFYEGTTCAVKDAFFEIDGKVVTLPSGQNVKTDDKGDFTIDVPIGEHYIEVRKFGHTFSEGRWPSDPNKLYDFQKPETGIPFKDNTKIILVGRAAGGTVEESKVPFLGRGNNNIGEAKITLRNTRDCGMITDSINNEYTRIDTFYTNPNTGEYRRELFPMTYTVAVELKKDPGAINFGTFEPIDLRHELELGITQKLETEYDTIFIPNTMTELSNDSIKYHQEVNFIHRSVPDIDVTNLSDEPFIGDEEATFTHSKYPSATLDLKTNPLLFPVFTQNRRYEAIINVFEEYTNIDNDVSERVPVVRGNLKVTNQLATQESFEIDLEANDTLQGKIPYAFFAGDPELQENTVDIPYSFTKTFQIELENGNSTPPSWLPFDYAADLPNTPSDQEFYRGYIFGSKAQSGTNFVTQGPSIVRYILRDPPGGASFATLAEGTTVTNTHGWSIDGGVDGGFNSNVTVGNKTIVGVGFITEMETKAQVMTSLTFGASIGSGGEYSRSTTSTDTYTTSSNANNVGAGSDLFMGQSQNYNFGLSDELGFYPVDVCDNNAIIDCYGDPVDGFRIGTSARMYVAPDEIATTFFLTQTDIINYEIPNLIALRNDRLSTDPEYDCTICDVNDPNFGKNNDDFEAFGADTTNSSMPGIKIRPSYTFTSMDSIDQVRVYNEQIRLWEEALALNEQDKIESAQVENFSFDGGGSSFERSVTTDSSSTHTWNFEFRASQTLTQKFKVEASIAGGYEFENKLTFSETIGYGGSNQQSNSKTVAYTLSDDDIWDRYSVDVQESPRGFGPVFKINAGESSCPHEGEQVSQYYEPGTKIANGTIQLEQPTLLIDEQKHSKKINVPEDEIAEFVFKLGNNSTQGWAYSLGLLNHTNPGGAIIVNSGTSELNTAPFTISSGQSTQQRIQVERGGAYEHDSLLFVFHSTCQYDQGNDFDADIADSAWLSVHFIPGCSDITIYRPDDQWILNRSYNERMPIIISDYDVNTNNFEKFILEYKPSNESTWNILHTYYKDTTGVNGNNFSQISNSSTTTTYFWDVLPLSDGDYDLRVTTDCDIATEESAIHSGYMDRQSIEVFGTPSPADGILDPNDDILLTMNETIDEGGVTSLNFDVRGVLNGTELRHETSLAFDGINAYAEIPEYQLQKRSMTIEFWLKRTGTGTEVILSQGQSNQDLLKVAFNSSDKLEFQLQNKTLTSARSITDNNWHHYAITYDRANFDGEIFIDFTRDVTNNSFGPDYSADGPILVGKDVLNGSPLFSGFLHELRLWSVPRSESQIAANALITLSGREDGLVGNWPMTEAYAKVAYDKVRSRHAQLFNTTWSILPKNHSFKFEGDSTYLEALDAGTLAFNDRTDLTLEAWFKTGSDDKVQTIFSNGKGDGTIPSQDFAWDIHLNMDGAVIISNDSTRMKTPDGFNDNNWHHFAAVVERTRAVSIYMDGELVTTGNARDFNGFAGPKVWIGARGWFEGSQDTVDQFFNGFLDDIRIWNTARQPEQIQRDFVNQLVGDELGLQAYYPFDGVTSDLGIFIREADLKDGSQNEYNLSLGGSSVIDFDEDAPPVKLPRLIEKVNFTYSINDDQIFIEVTDPPARVENVTLDITVRGLKDLAGNFMESPETWIAYIDKNQVFWEEEYFQFEKKLEDNLSFKAKIKNTGGSQESYSLSNLPSWLSASPSSGLIDPNSTVEVTFMVQPLLNIGEYEQDVYVATESFGFNERLLLDLKVIVDPPEWEVTPDDFSHSMNIVGQFEINDVISTNPEDMVSVWVNDEIRGVSHVEYDPSSGKNLVFLTVLSDTTRAEILEFRAWDASRGRLLKGLTPNDIEIIGGGIIGSRGTPIRIKANVLTQLQYVLTPGWNWISFPLASDSLLNANSVLREMSPTEGDQLKYPGKEHYFSEGTWEGGDTLLTSSGYKLKVAKADTFRYEGVFIDPATEVMKIDSGWNWIGVKSEFIIDVPSAMASLDPRTGAVIKGQRSFAIYEDGFGWGGNLDFLKPQDGYMLLYHRPDTLIYPGNLNARTRPETQLKSRSQRGKEYAALEKSLDYVTGQYSNTMSLTAEIDACIVLNSGEQELDLSQWSIVAYAGDECRGVVESTWISSVDKYLYYLSIEGSSGVEMNFKLVHNSNGSEISLSQKMQFSSNSVVGLNSSPYKFTCIADDCAEMSLFQSGDIDMSQSVMDQRVMLDLRSNALLPSDRIYRFRAGKSIELMLGFEVSDRATLEAYIEDCITTKQ